MQRILNPSPSPEETGHQIEVYKDVIRHKMRSSHVDTKKFVLKVG